MEGEITVQTQLVQYVLENEKNYLYIGIGLAVFVVLLCVFCLARYYGKKEVLK